MIPAVTNAGLVSSYNFDGNTLDSSGNAFHSYNSSPQVTLDPVNFSADTHNGIGSSAVFNNNSALSIDHFYSEIGEIAAMSFEVWFKSGEAFIPTVDKSKRGEDSFINWSFLDYDRSDYFHLSMSGQGQFFFGFKTAPYGAGTDYVNNVVFSDTTHLNDNEWHHAYVSYGEIGGLKITIDGQLDTQSAYVGAIGSGNTRYGNIGGWFGGRGF